MNLPMMTSGSAVPGLPTLTRQKKATIIVRLLQSEGVDLSLADLPDDLQIILAEHMSSMRYINRSTLNDVVEEFVSELEDMGLTFPRGVPRALDALQPSLSASATTKLRQAAGVDAPDNPWEWIAQIETDKLVPLLRAESIEIAAVALGKLKVTKSAEVIGALPGEQARKIAYMMSRTNAVTPEIVQKIGDALVAKLQGEPPRAFENPPAERVGSILNYARAMTRDDVLEGLLEEDEAFGEAVKRAIFTFKDIRTRVDPRDIPKVMREVDQEVAAVAFASVKDMPAEAEAMEFMLNNMSQRMANALREEADALPKPKAKDGEEAQNMIIAAIRLLNENGDLQYRSEDDAEDA